MSANSDLVLGQVEGKQKKSRIKIDMRAYTMIAALLSIWVLFSLLHERFLSATNLSNLFLQMSVTAVLAIGMVLVIVAGHIDLSVGSLLGFTGGIAAMLNIWYDWPAVPVILATLAIGAAIGFIQGWIIAYRAVPSFIVTLGGMMIFKGGLFGTTGSVTISPFTPSLKSVGQAYIVDLIGWIIGIAALLLAAYLVLRKRNARLRYGFKVESLPVSVLRMVMIGTLILGFVSIMNSYKGIPVPFIMVVVLALVFTFISKNTTFGRQVYAIGGNPEAARLSGINIKRRILMVFVLCNTLAAIAALIMTTRLNAATMSSGMNAELDAIAACVIGGTSLMGGAGTIIGAVIGALVMASLDNGMSLMNMESYWQYIVKGVILVLAVYVDISSRQRKKQA